jgi:mannose-6-phosphate isomerase-like protein (cupin superfamily)
MAKKYNNFRVGGSPSNVNEDYAVWTNDLLERVIASKTVIQPGKSTQGHKLIDSDVVYVITNGRGSMEVVEYMN